MSMKLDIQSVRMAVFDIDDTLIMRGSVELSSQTLIAIERLRSLGIFIVIATGRARYFIQDAIHRDVRPDFIISANGACVTDSSDALWHCEPMDPQEVQTLIAYAQKTHLALACKMVDQMDVYSGLDIFETTYMQGSQKQHILHPTSTFDEKKPVLGVFMMGKEALIEASEPLTQHATYAHAYHDAYDVYSRHAGKVRGIERVMRHLNIEWSQVIAFGDGANDVDMIRKAGVGIAMANAPENLKAHATWVTDTVSNDGVAQAIQKLFNEEGVAHD